MSENAIEYLKINKRNFSRDVLAAQLKAAGYTEDDIMQSLEFVYGENEGENNDSNDQKELSFWDFKSPKLYTKSSEKWQDFLFGFFAPQLAGLIGIVIPYVGHLLVFIFFVCAMIYLFNKRRFIFYGMIFGSVVLPIIFILFVFILFING